MDLQSFIHGFSIVLAVVSGGYYSHMFAKNKGFELKNLEWYLLWAFLSGVFGARIFYYFAYKDQFLGLWDLFLLQGGGLVSYGGIIFGSLAFAAILRSKNKPILKWFDFLSYGLLFGLVVGRIGDFLSGEENGIINIFSYEIAESLAEAFLSSLILIIIHIIWHKRDISKRFASARKTEGLTFSLVVLLYGGGRFFLDFARFEEKVFYSISLGQAIDLVFLIIGVYLIFTLIKKEKRC